MKQVTAIALPLQADSETPYYIQLYDEMRKAILQGTLPAGVRLPSTRALAKQFAISRNTVTTAFDQLLAEGYLEGRAGSGTFVASRLPEELLTVRTKRRENPASVRRELRLSKSAKRMMETPLTASVFCSVGESAAPRAFKPHLSAVEEFPVEAWLKISARCWRKPQSDLLGYGSAAGYRPLREQIAEYVKTSRAVHCEPEQVIVVSGSQQGLDLAARILVDPGESVWLEEPGYLGARAAFRSVGANLIPVPVDGEGLMVEVGIERERRARVAYVTPSHQYPIGATMSLCRRLALLEWAHLSNAWILEDDYDSEYRYAGRPLASLQGLDTQGRVIYLGTFSKVLLPSLRLGYLVVPPDLIDAFTRARGHADGHSPLVEQAALAEFIAEGHFARHIRRMRNLYEERQGYLVSALRLELSGILEAAPTEAGMNLIGWLPEGVDDRVMALKAAEAGIDATPLSQHALEPMKRGGLLLGYAALTKREITLGARKLAKALLPERQVVRN
ncbi:MAG: PLP-dependent aminotransferase family protein [Bryobacteraceae bacterium]